MPSQLAPTLSVCFVLVLLGGCASASGSSQSPAPAQELTGQQERPVVEALRILRGWDRRRAAAYSAGQPARLRNLYAPGSRAGAEDARVLREYVDRGLVVDGLTMQVIRVRLMVSSSTLIRLRVVDRMAGGTVVEPGRDRRPTALPTGRPTVRILTLVPVGPRWVVRSVRRG